jgi:hypothetical protein
MKEEALSGPPKAIWMANSSSTSSNTKSDDAQEEFEEDSEEVDSDEGSEPEEDSEEVDSDEGSEPDEGSDEEEDINLMDINDLPQGESNKSKGDFIRPAGSRPGIVFQHDDEDQERVKKNNPTAKTSDIDAVALRTYELSKLRYYFAIAIVNSSSTADHLYREVDGLELEHSSMALDLRIVPPEVSFQGRQVRDHCDKVSIDYVPPSDFVMNAKQV